MSSINHETVPVKIWADIDVGIAAEVRWLNRLDGVRTFTSCQGTIGEGGPRPYRAYIVTWWPKKHDKKIRQRFHVETIAHSYPPSDWYSLSPKVSA
jgi:hypothetical protein